ncbi:MAG: hypothetical protein U5K00_02245 [Melioribacteraceae bacterium]|nr:hypothetical protein [Melioribacteraceae bacterium]
MFSIEYIIIFIAFFLFAFALSFTINYKFLYKHFYKNNSYLVNRHIEDMQIYLNVNNRVKILESRIMKLIRAFRK